MSAPELVGFCGHLPLALRIAGARLAARPHWSVGQLVDRLANEARRLDELNHREMGVRASISLTYDHLQPAARRLFRLLAVAGKRPRGTRDTDQRARRQSSFGWRSPELRMPMIGKFSKG